MSPTVLPSSKRDQRLDFLRGVALVTIFINHVPGNSLENFTSRNFGFSDAAESFVLMSGIAAAFAYAKAVKTGLVSGIERATARAFKLYWVHLLITAVAFVAVLLVGSAFANNAMLWRNNMGIMQTDPVAGIIGIVTFSHQFGYFNILPLYCVLMLAAPAMIWAAITRPTAFLSASAALWFIAGAAHINFPNYPTDGGWFLNPLSWQFVFAIGIMIGVSVKEGRKFCSYHPAVFALALGYLVFACAVVQLSLWNEIAYPELPEVIAGFNKSFLTLPRLLHVLALAYVAIHMTAVARAANARWSKPIRLLGSNSLAVFASGSVICMVLQTFRNAYPTDGLDDITILSAGFALQFVAARWDEIKDGVGLKIAALAGYRTA